MPFTLKKRQKNKLYYSQHKNTINTASKIYYEANKQKVIERVRAQQEETVSVNLAKVRKAAALRKAKQYWTDPDKSKKDAQQRMYEHYHREPEKCRTATKCRISEYRERETCKSKAATRQSVTKYRQREPVKTRAATRHSVTKYRQREPVKARAATRQSVTKYRQTEPVKARAATRQSVTKYRQREPVKARAATRRSVTKYRQREPVKARAATRHSVSMHRQREPVKARAATRRSVAKYREREPEKSKDATRHSVFEYYHKHPEISRAAVKHRVLMYRQRHPEKNKADNRYWAANYYRRHLENCRRKSRKSSKLSYRKKTTTISRQRRDKYHLAEPRQQKITCLIKSFEDIFFGTKKVRSQIVKGSDSLPNCKPKKGPATSYAFCKLAASHLVRLSLVERKKAVTTLLKVKKCMIELTLDSEADFGKRSHDPYREPYFYDAAYNFEHLSERVKSSLQHNDGVHTYKYKPLPSPISVEENGQCHLSDIQCSVQGSKSCSADSRSNDSTAEHQAQKIMWTCSFRCKSLSDKDVTKIVSLKQIFHSDIPELRQSLEECDECPHVRSYKQEWHIPFRCEESTVKENDDSQPVKETAAKKPFKPVEWKGHPLVCHLPGSPCESKLRVLRAAVTHYPKLAYLQRNVNSARRAHFIIQKIDRAIDNKDYKALLVVCNTSFPKLFEQKVSQETYQSESTGMVPVSPLRVPHLEAQLLTMHAKVIKQYEKQVHDYAIYPCVSCEQLHKKSGVKEVYFDDYKENDVWLAIKAYQILTSPEEGDDPAYLCNYCMNKIKAGTMPSRCILNGLESPPLPVELKNLDPFCTQLIQLAKAFQTVIRLSTYTNKVPSYNSLKACKGNMFVLPLPLTKTIETLTEGVSELPKPELYVIVDGIPTKKKVVWRSFIDINKVKAALNKLREINWLYSKVKPDSVEKSTEDLVIEVANSARSEMVKKIKNKTEYTAGLQKYTLRCLNKTLPNRRDIDQYKMVNVEEFPINGTQTHLDLLCFPDLFPTGQFGEHHYRDIPLRNAEYIKSKLLNKDSRYRKRLSISFGFFIKS